MLAPPRLPEEHWRPVLGHEGSYLVSSVGRVWSIRRKGADGRLVGGRILLSPHGPGKRPRASLLKGGRQQVRLVHQLVAEAFIPNPAGRGVVRHYDDNPKNNNYKNLRWGTQAENMADKIRNGLDHNANKTHCIRGHRLSGANVVVRSGSRHCQECNRIRARKAYAKRKMAMIEAEVGK